MIIKPANRLSSVEEYYFSTKLKEIREMQQAGAEIINLGIGSPDLAPEEKMVSKLMEESLKKGNHSYQSYTGIDELREAFADFYRNHFGVELSKSESPFFE
jgi:aspartate/methionine/tyrosine aminotransferase